MRETPLDLVWRRPQRNVLDTVLDVVVRPVVERRVRADSPEVLHALGERIESGPPPSPRRGSGLLPVADAE